MSSSPQRSHPLLRVLNHTEATEVECLLHSAAFGKKDRNIFFSNVVSRDGTPVLDNNGDVYQQLHTDYSLGSADPPDSILVLSEYRTALKDIEQWFNGGPDDFPTPIVPDDHIWSRWGDFPAMEDEQSNEKESESDSSSRDTEQQIEGDSSVSDKVDLSDNRQTVQIIGIPGTGKSLCLLYILAERLLKGLETCLQTRANHFTLFCSEGAYKVYIDERFEDVMKDRKKANILPMTTWYLVDSNQKISYPPEEIQCTDTRIVQVSSLKSSCLDWVKKTSTESLRYMMKPPTLQETILMRDCQHSPSVRTISDSMISDFRDKYGPSARELFKNANTPATYDRRLKELVAKIDAKTLKILVEETLDGSKEVSPFIFGVYPGAFRSDRFVNILTKYIYQLVKNAPAAKEHMGMRRMYRLFKNHFLTRAAAGYMFEDRLQELLLKGGSWIVNQMVKRGGGSKNFTYTDSESRSPSQWLCVGGLTYLADRKPQETTMPLELCRYNEQSVINSELTQPCIYYQSDSPVCDSHVVNTQEKQVTVFQFTVASNHAAKESGLAWLKQRYGDYRVNYVVFADPELEMTIYIPRAYDSFLATKLLVTVKEDDLFPLGFGGDSTAEKRTAIEESDGRVLKKVCVEK